MSNIPELETTVIPMEAARSFRVQRADGTVEEYISSVHWAQYDEDADACRVGLGWVDAEGNYTPVNGAPRAGRPGATHHVVNAGTGSFVSSHTSLQDAETRCDEANAAVRDAGDIGDDEVAYEVREVQNTNVSEAV